MIFLPTSFIFYFSRYNLTPYLYLLTTIPPSVWTVLHECEILYNINRQQVYPINILPPWKFGTSLETNLLCEHLNCCHY